MKIRLLLIVTLAGCASTPAVPAASPIERKAAVRAYMACLVPIARRMDDGISDARTIAVSLRGACPVELRGVFEIANRGQTSTFREAWAEASPKFEESTALHAVLIARKAVTQD